MRIVDLCHINIVPPDYGGKQATYYRLKKLSEENEVLCISIDSEAEYDAYMETKINSNFIYKLYKAIRIPIKRAGIVDFIAQFISWFKSGQPRKYIRIYDKAIRDKIIEEIVNFSPDIIYIESPFSLAMLDFNKINKSKVKIICVVHNQEKEFFKHTNTWPAFLQNVELDRIDKLEKKMINLVDNIYCLSPTDYDYFKIISYKTAYTPVYLESAKRKWIETNSNYIIFAGNLSFKPNYNGIKWIAENVLNIFELRFPDIKIKITGKVSNKIKSQFKKYKSIEFTGYLEEGALENLMLNSLYALIPIWDGGGVKIKLLEAMKYGVPAITTPHGKMGVLSSTSNDNNIPFIVASDAAEFISKMTMMAKSKEMRIKISNKEIEFFTTVYSSDENILRWIGR